MFMNTLGRYFAGRFVTADGTPVASDTPYTPASLVWFHKDPTEEQPPAPLPVLHAGERLVVVDKPHFLATIPRGAFVRRSEGELPGFWHPTLLRVVMGNLLRNATHYTESGEIRQVLRQLDEAGVGWLPLGWVQRGGEVELVLRAAR